MNKIKITNKTIASMEDFYGIFFEDINHAADGGLYGEMIRNRAFEFSPIDNPSYQALTAWKKIEEGGASVSVMVSDETPLSAKNPHYLVLSVEKAGSRAGIKNLGYNSGIAVQKGGTYRFSCYARANKPCNVNISIESADGRVYVSKNLYINAQTWTQYLLELIAPESDYSAVMSITSNEICKFCMDFVSLFPKDTYKGRENGMRKDIAIMLADLKPRFMRFPGGCLVHDGSLNANDRNSMYRWKNTVGSIIERPSRRCNWRYNQSLGIGYYEYFQFCEDIGAKPLPVLPAGYNPHMEQAAPLDEMQEWIDDALDLIEFANGSTDTKWGAVRAKMGHIKPFGLEYLAIGNEEVGQSFWDRYDLFHKAIREKHPEIKLINSAGPFPAGGEFERGWENARKNGSDFVDEHYYTSPEWMLANYNRYDNLPDGPKVFLGEYATWGNSFYNALVEAAYMTGLENNASHVGLACYAPLLCNTDYINWQPNLIWFNNHQVYGSANYYVQKLFMNNTGTKLLKTEKTGLEQALKISDNRIAGSIEIKTEECNVDFYDIIVTDITNSKVTKYDSFSLASKESKHIADIDAAHYKIEFKATRRIGEKCFTLNFGKKDDKNFIRWFIGGWANQDTELNSVINGRGTALDHNIFSIATGCEYKFCIEINQREITTYINERMANKAIDKLPVVEELYYTASSDDNYIYVKCVNVRKDEVTVWLCIDGIENIDANVYILSADYDDKNSFDNPMKVAPTQSKIAFEQNDFEYTFLPKSITIFAIKKV